MLVGDVMTQPVITVMPETAVAEAAALMLQHRISGLPVVAPEGDLVGIITEGDLLRRAETGTERRHPRWLEFLMSPGRLAQEYASANARKVSEIMTTEVATVAPQAGLDEVVRLMEQRHVKRLPVVEGDRLVGIVSRANLVRALIRNLPVSAAGSGGDDAEIRDRILAQIEKQPWGPRASVDVRVDGGVVELDGAITDERERAALRVLAENTAGVKEVRDRLVWVEPMSGFALPAGEDEGTERR